MEFFEVLKARRSVRAFEDTPVEDDKLKRILEAASSAPSAGNLQAYEIFLVRDAVRRRMLAEAALSQDFVAEAPVVLVFCANPDRSSWRYGRRGVELYSLQDATIAASYAQLAAVGLGLASVWVGAFYDEEVSEAIGVKGRLRPVAVIPIGYPAEKPRATSRRSLKDLVHELEASS